MAILKGLPLCSYGFQNVKAKHRLVIHAMAEYIFYEGQLRPAADLLKYIDRGAHFTVLPHGRPVEHIDPSLVAWHAKGYNSVTAGAELLIPGIIDYGGLLREMARECAAFDVYSRGQYRGLIDIISHLLAVGYLDSPLDYTFHEDLSPGRKFDPGPAFDRGVFHEMVLLSFGL